VRKNYNHLKAAYNKAKLFLLLTGALCLMCLNKTIAQQDLKLDVSNVEVLRPSLLRGLGGTNPAGDKIEFNQDFITRNGVAEIPITGEFHFSRYPAEYWDESLKKMKAGGVNTVATYIFWNIHEEKEGVFNFSGNRDVRKFIDLCAKNKLDVIVRIGPFCHGEIRNGGLPDWLLSKPLSVRSNDPNYLHYVELLYNEIGKQLKGLYFKDGGPIIGIQLENEYQHSASPWALTYPGQPNDLTVDDRDRAIIQEGVGVSTAKNPYADLGNDHMRTLKALAQRAGIVVPLYTATGWGHAAIIPGETLPVTAAYAYPNWTKEPEESTFYLYKDMHKNPDYSPVRYDPLQYPVFPAEIGSGIMDCYSRRPVVPAESVDAIINRCLGSGANGIGYYMFHGGSTPVGEHYFFSDEAFGYPKISYDFQAPIGEYGQVRPSYNRLKLLHFFINDFGHSLAHMATVLPANAASVKPSDTSTLRFAVRTNGSSGYLFINNFQDQVQTEDHRGIAVTIDTKEGLVRIPQGGGFTLAAGENIIFPFNEDFNGSRLIYATAQLLCQGGDPANPYVVFFYPDKTAPEFLFAKKGESVKVLANAVIQHSNQGLKITTLTGQTSEFVLTNAKGIRTTFLVISKNLATQAFVTEINGLKHLVFIDGEILDHGKEKQFLTVGKNNFTFSVFPKINMVPKAENGMIVAKSNKVFSEFDVSMPEIKLEQPRLLKTGSRKVALDIPDKLPNGLNDIFLEINYTGDTGMGFMNDDLVCDNLFNGTNWEIGLKRFIGKGREMGFYFRPLLKGAPFLVDLPSSIAEKLKKEGHLLSVDSVSFVPEYESLISFK
jgi:beta-galactosidase